MTRSRKTFNLLAALAVFGAICMVASVASAKRRGPLKKLAWLSKTTVTEYFPAPEKWFVGATVPTPGLKRRSRIDWLYSSHGMAMEGDGIGTDGKRYHIDNVGNGGWIARNGKRASFGSTKNGPFWRSSGYWRNRKHHVTFPLLDGGWFSGTGKRWVAPKHITFAAGPSLPLHYYRSLAVDPTLIPLGSIVYIGRYAKFNRDGWFRAADTGGAIVGRHVDVYRKPPASPDDGGDSFSGVRIFVVPARKVAKYVAQQKRKDTDGLPVPPNTVLHQ